MYCKFFINSKDQEKIISVIKNGYGNCTRKNSCFYFDKFDICLLRNKEMLPEGEEASSDRFLFYPTIADLDIYSDHAAVTDRILLLMRQNNIHTVASCDYEDELKYNGFYKGELI